MTTLPFRLDRTIVINARVETVFRFFTDSARFAAWWGAGSSIDPRVGGSVQIQYPGGVLVRGEVVTIEPSHRIVFTYGYVSGTPFGVGASLVTVELNAVSDGTRLSLTHDFGDADARDHHVQGWRYQLSLFGNLVSDEICADAGSTVDAWFATWAQPDAAQREASLSTIARQDVRFRDRYSLIDRMDELLPHITASLQFMPGVRLTRDGDVRHCQGTVLANWTATGADGRVLLTGTNVFTLDADGRIASATGLANATH